MTSIKHPAYVLVTPAHNEERNIEGTLESVVSQMVKPRKWIVVSDASTDCTDRIVSRYAGRWPFIELRRVERKSGPDFASKVRAFKHGMRCLAGTDFEFVGNLDADVSLDRGYYRGILDHFTSNPSLGIAGGGIYQWSGEAYSARPGNTLNDVAGAALTFRRICFEEIGGYLPLEYGGEDWCAQIAARMKGWRVASFPDLRVYHHGVRDRPDGLQRSFQRGRMDFFVGSHPIFELLRVLRRGRHRPFGIGAIVRLYGFFSSYFLRRDRIVPDEIVRFLRCEEFAKISDAVSRATGVPHKGRSESQLIKRR